MTPPRRLTADEQQRILEAQQSSPSFDDAFAGYRISDQPDPSAKTSPVTPSVDPSGRPIVWADQGGVDTGTTLGRGNDPSRSGGSRMPPPVVGLQLPMPGQLTGSNEPGSTVHQLPTVTQQYPVQTINIPKSLEDAKQGLKFDPQYPALSPVDGEQGGTGVIDDKTTSSHANPYPPYGRIAPRTPAGNDANPLSPGDSGVAQQVSNPVREFAFTDRSRSDARASNLVQEIPASHIHAGTLRQRGIIIPNETDTSYHGVNDPRVADSSPKTDALASSGIQRDIPQNILTGGVRPQKNTGSILREGSE